MITKVGIKNFTVFSKADLNLSPQLNVIIGENGSGKTHLLKIIYCILAVSAEEGRKRGAQLPTKSNLQTRLVEKIMGVFRPEYLGRLARRKQGREKCDLQFSFTNKAFNLKFNFATNTKSEVNLEILPQKWLREPAAFFPTRELLSIYPNFASVYDSHYLEFEETWRDTCILLAASNKKGVKEKRIAEILNPLETSMEGKIILDTNGRFYLRQPGQGIIEIHLVAEGLRKLGMVARLVSTGTLLDNGYLFWDEPEANLNPRLIKEVAKTILILCQNGIQVFLATHSLFILREFEILMKKTEFESIKSAFFGLQKSNDGFVVNQGTSIDKIGDISSLDEELQQSDRYLEVTE